MERLTHLVIMEGRGLQGGKSKQLWLYYITLQVCSPSLPLVDYRSDLTWNS